jgi:hypothetical protein
MDTQQLDELKFLLKLLECSVHRAKLTGQNSPLKSFKDKNDICQRLGLEGLVDFSREIAELELAPPGRALLELDTKYLPIKDKELKVLQKIGKTSGKMAPSKISSSIVKAAERDTILQTFWERGYISVVTKPKKTNADVWLTDKGKECLSQVVSHFQQLRQSSSANSTDPIQENLVSIPDEPNAQHVLDCIQTLDLDLGTNNYLPIFHLREKLQPPLSRDALDQLLFELEDKGKIDLKSVVHSQDYTPEQIQMGIQQGAGSLLFFIQVMG